jgi:hypothetical protein
LDTTKGIWVNFGFGAGREGALERNTVPVHLERMRHPRFIGILFGSVLACLPQVLTAQAQSLEDGSALPRLTLVKPSARLVLAFPTHLKALRERALLPQITEDCAAIAAPVSPDAQLVTAVEQAIGDSGFAIAAAPGELRRGECTAAWDYSALAIWRGLSLGPPDSLAAIPARIALIIDGDTISPLRTFVKPAFVLSGGAWHPNGQSLVSVYRVSNLSQRPSLGKTEVVVWHTDGRHTAVPFEPESHAILSAEVAAHVLARASTASGLPFVLDISNPVVASVTHFLREAASGRVALADQSAARWLADSAALDNTVNSAVARLLVAEALARAGEPVRAASFAAMALRDRPCAVIPSSSTVAMAAASHAATGFSCQQVSPNEVLRQGLMLPGGGHRVLHGGWASAIVGVATGALVASAVSSLRSAEQTYTKYKAAADYSSADALYATANRQRQDGALRLAAGLSLWAGDAFLTRMLAGIHNAAVRHAKL